MRVLVTGGNGQLASEIFKINNQHECRFPDEIEFDVTDEKKVYHAISTWKPDAVIHCAAYTNVDGAEKEKELAYKINTEGTALVAKACNTAGSKLIYISTDYVFDGTKGLPYIESDEPNPINYYGITKLLGEKQVRENCKQHFIIRTSWLYGTNGNNFVKTILRLAKTQEQIRVVDDQKGTPTNAADLALALLTIIDTDKYGTYNYSNMGEASWYDFAKKIISLSELKVQILPINSLELAREAKRPSYSVLSKELIKDSFNLRIRHWERALEDYLRK